MRLFVVWKVNIIILLFTPRHDPPEKGFARFAACRDPVEKGFPLAVIRFDPLDGDGGLYVARLRGLLTPSITKNAKPGSPTHLPS